jgi:hypothetical protein
MKTVPQRQRKKPMSAASAPSLWRMYVAYEKNVVTRVTTRASDASRLCNHSCVNKQRTRQQSRTTYFVDDGLQAEQGVNRRSTTVSVPSLVYDSTLHPKLPSHSQILTSNHSRGTSLLSFMTRTINDALSSNITTPICRIEG